MRYLLLSIVLLCTSLSQIKAQVSFSDSLTGAVFIFPEGVDISNVSQHQFKKCDINAYGSFLSVFSMRDTDKKRGYSWDVINQFDENNKYGSFVETKRIPLDGLTGWFRLYEKIIDGEHFYNCVSIIKGKDYVEYLLETAVSQDNIITPRVIAQSSFPKYRVSWLSQWRNKNQPLLLIVAIILMLLPFGLFVIKKRMSTSLKITLTVIATIIGTFALSSLGFWLAFAAFALIAATWSMILFVADSWRDVWDLIKKILESI